MSYQPETIATVVSRLNNQYFLPAIQREFVWEPEQIEQLFDSIMRGYPISSFLFWELKPENHDRWEVYDFVTKAHSGGTRNQITNTNGKPQLTLVLDGQQRLTSLMIGLRGSYVVKKKWKRKGNAAAYEERRLFLDLLRDSSQVEFNDDDLGVYFGFKFLPPDTKPDAHHWWFEVGKVLNFDSDKKFDDFRDAAEEQLPETFTKKQVNVFRRNLETLYRSVWKENVVAFYTEKDQDYDRVLDIFVRANEGGTKLSKSDLLLSMVINKWSGINAREEIYGFVKRLNEDLTRRNDFDKDFIMKSCLVLSDLSIKYSVQNFNNDNLTLIEKNWENIRSAIERGVDLVNRFGIDRETLTSVNALIPVIYWLYQRPGLKLVESTAYSARNAMLIRRWLVLALLANIFGAASDTRLAAMRDVLQKHAGKDDDFPLEELAAASASQNRPLYLDDQAIENILDIEYGEKTAFLALSLLYDEIHWGTFVYHKDHIIPQAMFKPKSLAATKLSKDKQKKLLDMSDRIGNLQLLLDKENLEKKATEFPKWIKGRDKGFLSRHLIPADPELWKLENFDRFVEAREKLILDRLRPLLGTAKGK